MILAEMRQVFVAQGTKQLEQFPRINFVDRRARKEHSSLEKSR